MTWDGIVLHKVYMKKLTIIPVIEAYMHYIVIKKTKQSISFDYRRGVEENTADQMPKLCNTVKSEEETKIEDEGNKEVVI